MSLPARLKHIDSLKKENQIDYTAALFLMYIFVRQVFLHSFWNVWDDLVEA